MGNLKKVSVIIPNYNYARYLEERMKSIVNQTYPIYELIILDDASTDDSVNVIENFIQQNPNLDIKVEVNSLNSGSVFKQWFKGIAHATGDYIWIAEADDLSAPTFLEKAMSGFDLDDDVILSYCQSSKIDKSGNIIESNYLAHTDEIDVGKWKETYIRSGIDEICDSLIVKNTIPNASAVVFKNIDVSSISEEVCSFRLAGDWRFYIGVLEHGKIHFHPEPLNYHRFHSNSVRESVNRKEGYVELLKIQNTVLERFDVHNEIRENIEVLHDAIQKNIQALEHITYDMYLCDLQKKVIVYENVALYGSGAIANSLIEFFSEHKINVSCVIEETNTSKIGEDLAGVPIVSLEAAKSFYGIEAIVIASNYYQYVIYDRIKHLDDEGIRVLKIID